MTPTRWLLLRGLAREQRHWGRFRAALEAGLPGARIHCLDLPGAGTEHSRKSPAAIRAIAEDLRSRWLALPGEGPWGLCAVSLGGMVAMEWCGAHPADFDALVLVNTSAANLSVPWRRMRLRVLPQVLRALVEQDRAAREERILGITTRMRADLPALAREWAGYFAERPMSRWNVLRQLTAASRFRAPSALRPRTLVLSGAQDPFTDPGCPKRLAAHFGAELRVHPRAGHDLATDDPDWLAAEVARFSESARWPEPELLVSMRP
jgi:pimeloyl-ACP methyl ester carboxylesterase